MYIHCILYSGVEKQFLFRWILRQIESQWGSGVIWLSSKLLSSKWNWSEMMRFRVQGSLLLSSSVWWFIHVLNQHIIEKFSLSVSFFQINKQINTNKACYGYHISSPINWVSLIPSIDFLNWSEAVQLWRRADSLRCLSRQFCWNLCIVKRSCGLWKVLLCPLC